jgi:hypothetical protein
MTAIERYLQELGRALHTRGRARRRLLAECAEHLADAAALSSGEDAVRSFGSATDLAESFDAESAVRRATAATGATIAGVLATGASAVALVNAADPRASAVAVWAVIFFAGAQAAGVCTLLAALRAGAMRHRTATPVDVVLLCRRNAAALAFSATTLIAAAGAVPGHAAAWEVLAGPVAAVLAAVQVLRARSLARKLDTRPCRIVRAPLTDLLVIGHQSDRAGAATRRSPVVGLLVPTVALATVAAFLWDRLDHGNVGSSLSAAGIEAALTVAGFGLFGPVLGLMPPRSKRGRGSTAV